MPHKMPMKRANLVIARVVRPTVPSWCRPQRGITAGSFRGATRQPSNPGEAVSTLGTPPPAYRKVESRDGLLLDLQCMADSREFVLEVDQ